MANSNAMFGANPKESRSDEWETPKREYEDLNAIAKFALDAAASDQNHKCALYLTEADDALTKDWAGLTNCGNVWVNPPYSNAGDWVRKAEWEAIKGCTVWCLLPPRLDTWWWHEIVAPALKLGNAQAFRYYDPSKKSYRGRIKFVEPPSRKKKSGPSAGNVLVVFRPPMPAYWHPIY